MDREAAERAIPEMLAEAEKDYQRWRRLWDQGFRAISDHNKLISYYARLAYAAELKKQVMGHEVAKLQARIGRQRAANNKMRRQMQERELAYKKQMKEAEGVIDAQQKYMERQASELTRLKRSGWGGREN